MYVLCMYVYMYACMYYVWLAEKGVEQRDKGGVTVSLHAHDAFGSHIHHVASALRDRTLHSYEADAFCD